MSNPIVFDVGPEARLATLFDLVERCGRAQQLTCGTGESDLDAALGEFRKAAGEQIRALSTRLLTESKPSMVQVPAEELKAGDEVWIRAVVRGTFPGNPTPVQVSTGTDEHHWPNPSTVYRAV